MPSSKDTDSHHRSHSHHSHRSSKKKKKPHHSSDKSIRDTGDNEKSSTKDKPVKVKSSSSNVTRSSVPPNLNSSHRSRHSSLSNSTTSAAARSSSPLPRDHLHTIDDHSTMSKSDRHRSQRIAAPPTLNTQLPYSTTVPELLRRVDTASPSKGGSTVSSSYPSFSKQHCREVIGIPTSTVSTPSNAPPHPYSSYPSNSSGKLPTSANLASGASGHIPTDQTSTTDQPNSPTPLKRDTGVSSNQSFTRSHPSKSHATSLKENGIASNRVATSASPSQKKSLTPPSPPLTATENNLNASSRSCSITPPTTFSDIRNGEKPISKKSSANHTTSVEEFPTCVHPSQEHSSRHNYDDRTYTTANEVTGSYRNNTSASYTNHPDRPYSARNTCHTSTYEVDRHDPYACDNYAMPSDDQTSFSCADASSSRTIRKSGAPHDYNRAGHVQSTSSPDHRMNMSKANYSYRPNTVNSHDYPPHLPYRNVDESTRLSQYDSRRCINTSNENVDFATREQGGRVYQQKFASSTPESNFNNFGSNAPRVDYLLQNGGLTHTVPRVMLLNFVFPQSCEGDVLLQDQSSTQPDQYRNSLNSAARSIFSPFKGLLDDYDSVISRNGSLAVASGYRSVARRLLDRLEAVFARNISSEYCKCVICEENAETDSAFRRQMSYHSCGMSWGEVLEYVSGRQELPCWPPFFINMAAVKARSGMFADEKFEAPMKYLDIDVPQEYREHYIRQSKKTKLAVQNWLSSQPEEPSSPPAEVDDDTLTFAILTHLEPDERQMFQLLLHGNFDEGPVGYTHSVIGMPESETIGKGAVAIQRLYRLSRLPRPAEVTLYLLKNVNMHGVLATLAAISEHEWDILTSGRFDGFLWSGAEEYSPDAHRLGRVDVTHGSDGNININGSSRNGTTTTNGSGGRNSSTSAGVLNDQRGRGDMNGGVVGRPVQLDEETEIAVVTEIEKEIYLCMEALENAFEDLHNRAEAVRQRLRERGVGLILKNRFRNGHEQYNDRHNDMVRDMDGNLRNGWDVETDDGLGDDRSEIAPDDSASNVSHNRRKRTEWRNRHQPATIKEEDSEDASVIMNGANSSSNGGRAFGRVGKILSGVRLSKN